MTTKPTPQVWKFVLPFSGLPAVVEVLMPAQAEPLEAGVQNGELVIWAGVLTSNPEIPHKFALFGTGQDVPFEIADGSVYFRTVQLQTHTGHFLVVHIFDLGDGSHAARPSLEKQPETKQESN